MTIFDQAVREQSPLSMSDAELIALAGSVALRIMRKEAGAWDVSFLTELTCRLEAHGKLPAPEQTR
jgi:hypothetical protein